jgi:hypothetical protein
MDLAAKSSAKTAERCLLSQKQRPGAKKERSLQMQEAKIR